MVVSHLYYKLFLNSVNYCITNYAKLRFFEIPLDQYFTDLYKCRCFYYLRYDVYKRLLCIVYV